MEEKSMARRIVEDRDRVLAARQTERTDAFMGHLFPDASRELREGLDSLEAKLQAGNARLTKSDLRDYMSWSAALLSALEGLTGTNSGVLHQEKDQATVQDIVDRFVAGLLEDNGDLSVAIHRELAEGIHKQKSKIIWSTGFSGTREREVEVLIPSAILNDEGLLELLQYELQYDGGDCLSQEPKEDIQDEEHEVTIE